MSGTIATAFSWQTASSIWPESWGKCTGNQNKKKLLCFAELDATVAMKIAPPTPSMFSVHTIAGQSVVPQTAAPVDGNSQLHLNGVVSVTCKNASAHKRVHSPSSDECFKRLKDVKQVRVSRRSYAQGTFQLRKVGVIFCPTLKDSVALQSSKRYQENINSH